MNVKTAVDAKSTENAEKTYGAQRKTRELSDFSLHLCVGSVSGKGLT
jgi:hypothetical protein